MIISLYDADTKLVLVSRPAKLKDYAKPWLLSLIIKANVYGTAVFTIAGGLVIRISIGACS